MTKYRIAAKYTGLAYIIPSSNNSITEFSRVSERIERVSETSHLNNVVNTSLAVHL
jgi:hypothetical protein